jgi:hypothetical protein
MGHAKTLGLVALAVAGSMAFAGGAQAVTLTSPAGTQLGVGTEIHAVSEGHTVLDGSLTVECESTVSGEIDAIVNEIPTGEIDALTFEECTNKRTVTVLDPGSFEIHTAEEGTSGIGTLTSSGAKVTVLAHLPFNITIHCIYTTNETDIGRVTDSANTGGTPKLHIDTAPIERESTDFGCGSTSEWTGSYKFTSPDFLEIENVPGTTLTAPAGETLGVGAELHAENSFEVFFDFQLSVICKSSTLEGEVTDAGGTGTAVTAAVTQLTFEECGTGTVMAIAPGSLEVHAADKGNGTLTWLGGKITWLTHLPFGTTMHCIFSAKTSHLGTLTSSENEEGQTAKVDAEALMQRESTDFGCSTSIGEMTAIYTFTAPDYLDVD